MATLGKNQVFEIKNGDGTSFHNLVLRKSAVESIVMSLGDKISGDVYYKDNSLSVTMHEYITYNGVNYMLVNPPTIVREGIVSDNSELKGMTKYSFVFYHPMCQLANFPFTDVAVTSDETRYLSEGKTFPWIGKPADFVAKLNKNLTGTEWIVEISSRFPQDKLDELSNVIQFDNATIADACKIFYDTWGVPYVVDKVASTEASYAAGKRFKLVMGLPSNEIYENESARQLGTPYVFQMGQGVGLKNNSRTPRNNKIVTRIAGYGSEDNVPYGYPQIVWTGNQDWDYTINNDPDNPLSYPIYKGIVGGQYVKLIKHPFTRTHLMPSIFTETVNKKVNPNADGYDPTIEIKDYYDAVATQEYPYVNEINLQVPSYESHEFTDIKPELDADRSTGIVSAVPLNSDLTPADHWDDAMDDDGNYLQSYFQITLPQLSFDLYACAAITQEMKINMRSGACIGCTFPVQVDLDDYKRNFYDEEGNFVPDGEQRDLTKYPKSNLGQISVVVQKDNSTFGTLMPNIYQQPKANDLFVFIGISLPLSYIANAEERLDDAMKTYMLENNVYYFDYPLKFDEHFLATHTYILEQIRPNSIIRFDYGGVEQQLFVKQLTVKYGNAPLPQYDITLTDNVEVVLNQIGQVADDVEKLSSLIAVLRQSYNRNVWNELAKKLSKTQDDTAAGFITVLKGLQVGNQFVSGLLGEGGVFRRDADGKTYLEADKMYIRMRAYFDTVEVREYKHSAGNRVASPAGAKCVRVAWFNSSNEELEQTQENLSSVAYFRCYFRADDGEDTVRNNFVVGDQVYCHITTVNGTDDNPSTKGLNQKHYWRLCIGKNTDNNLTEDGEGWVDLSNRSTETIGGKSYTGYQTNSDVPEPQDSMVQLGNVNDTTRQGAIIEFVTGGDAPSYQIYQGINSFSLVGRNMITLGYNSATGKAELKVYGDAFIGDPNRTTYIEYVQDDGAEAHAPKLKIKAEIEATSTIGGQSLPNYIKANQTTYDKAIADLQNQIDGAIDTWFYNGAPSDSVLPESEWKAIDIAAGNNNERLKHLGDIYYDNKTGYAYRYTNTGTEQSPTFAWSQISDSAVIEALQKAAKAQATADGKMTIYSVWGAWMKNNVNTLKVGDLFIPNADTEQGTKTYKAKKVYKCTTDGVADFEEIAYTDDTTVERYMDILANGMNNPQTTKEISLATERAIRNALGGATVLAGGLMLTSLIGLRQFDGGDASDYRNYTTWAGISGQYNANALGKGIAAWYGGDMVDKEALSAETIALGWGSGTGQYRWAKGVDRFDGSGYRAGGNLSWDKEGKMTIANVYSDVNGTLIPWSGTTLQYMTNLSNILPISLVDGVTYLDPKVGFKQLSVLGKEVATKEWANGQFVTKTFFDNIFRLYNGTTKINVNDTIPSSTNLNIEAMFGFWTKKYISALGQGDDGSTSYSTLAALNDVTLTNPTANQILVYDGTHWRNQNQQSVYELPVATTTTLGGIMLGYAASGKNYALQLDANGKAYVNVPWENTTYSLPLAASGTRGGIQLGYTQSGKNYPVQLSGEKAYVNVPWENTVYTLPQATTSALGGIKVGYDGTTAKTYAIALDNNGRAYVNVPWTDTTYDLSGYATTSQLNALEYFNQITGGSCAFILKTNKNREYVVDLTHEHSWFDLVDTPTTLGGFGLKNEVQQLIADYTAKKYVSIDWLNRVLRAYNNTTQVAPNDLTTTIDNLKLMVGTWTEQYLTALGRGSDGGGGGQGDVTWTLLAQQATNNRTIHQSYIADILSSYATTSWVTGQNYATQTWVEGKGYATTTQLNALEFLSAITGGDGVVTLTTNKNNSTILDLSHEHSFLELLDRPTTVAGYGITDAVKSIMIGTKTYTSTDGIITLPTYYITTDSRAANTVLAAPNGASGAATFRSLVAADIPALTKSKISDFPTTWDWSNITNKPTAWAWTAITGKPTTIAGYGITDAKIVDGVITLGAVNITPITSVAMTVPTGFSISGSPISKAGTLALSYASGYEGFTTELKNKINSLFSWFEVDSSGNVKTKDYVENGTTKHRGFYSPSFVSALGQGDDGQSGVGDVTWELLEEPATNNRSIHLSYISSALASYLTSNSYIQSSAISDMATKTWVGQQGYLKQASLSNYYTKSEVYTKTEVDALARVKAIAWSEDGITFTWQDNSTTIADFSHEHSFLELLDRPSTIDGYGISLTADDIPNLPWGKITSGKPTTIGGYGITDAVTSVKIGTNSYAPASGIVTLPAYPTNYYSNTDSRTANTVLAAPNGSNGVATFRSLVAADIPTLTKSKISDFPTSWAWSALTGVPTTLAGYGITDAKIVDGVITLGANTITPITSVAMTVPTGFSVSGSPISKTGTFAVSYASGYEGFTTTLKNKIDLLYSLFTREGSGTSADPYIIKANYGLYTEKFLSALGHGDDGQSGAGDVTWALLSQQATDGRTIHASYLTQALSGYATQSWVSNQNYATQTWVTGKNYATQSWVSGLGYATQSWVTSQAYATTSSVTTTINALTYFNAATVVDDYGFKLSGHGVDDVYIDLTHEHSWFELLDRPSTLTGLGVTVTASDIPNLDWSKITTGKPTTLAGYGIADAVASISINGTSYIPSNKVVTLPVYTSTQVDALARLKTLALTNDGVLTFTHQDNSTSVVDFSHEHSFFELLDRPTSIKGYGITILESDIPNLPWSKITSGKPTTVAGYGITDAITTGNIGNQSVSYATTAGTANNVSWGNVGNKPSAAGNGTTPVYWTGSGFTACTPYSSASVNYANSAGNTDTVDGYHESAFLHLTGGTMSGGLILRSNAYSGTTAGYGLDCANSDIIGVNSIYTNDVSDGWDEAIMFKRSNGNWDSLYATDGNFYMKANNGGNSATLNLCNVYASGYVTALSDARHKTIVRNTNISVEQIAAMRSVIYRWSDRRDNSLHVGSIAQDWQGVLPQVVSVADDKEHTLGLQYGVAALISAITVARKVMTHEEKIALLETRVSALEKENGEQEQLINSLQEELAKFKSA